MRIGTDDMDVLMPDVPTKDDGIGTRRYSRRAFGIGRLTESRASPFLPGRRIEDFQTGTKGDNFIAENVEFVYITGYSPQRLGRARR